MSDIVYLDDAQVHEVKIEPAPASAANWNGYGGKVPTRYMLKYNHRWHRVYMMQYGNAGTPYIVSRRTDLILSNDTEHRLEALTH
jgi:hypothetical protein